MRIQGFFRVKKPVWWRRLIRHLTKLCSIVPVALAGLVMVAPIPAEAQSALDRLVQVPRLKPAPPGHKYLSANDYRILKAVTDDLGRRSWSNARQSIASIKDDSARSLGQWYYFESRDPDVDVTEGIVFLNNHDGWPSLAKIQRHLEDHIDERTPVETVYALFQDRDPLTGNGKLQLLRMLMARGETQAVEIYVRDAWRNHPFTQSEERTILNAYGTWLRPEDHVARVDHLLWARKVTSARRSFNLLPRAERCRAETRAELYLRAAGAEQSYYDLSVEDRLDAGVQHAAIRYFRRIDNEDVAISLVRTLPDDPKALRNPARFWNERSLLMRWALKNGRFSDAYDMAHAHGLEDGLDLAEAEFNAGWIALRFLDDPERAETHFLALANWATSPISSARAYYWLGRAAKARRADDLARARFAIAAAHLYTYYGQLAAEELGGAYTAQRFVTNGAIEPIDHERFDRHPAAQAFRMITDLNDRRALLIFSYTLDDQLETPGEYLVLADLTIGEDAPHLTVRAGKTAVRNDTLLPEISYPLVRVPEGAARFAAPELILGLSRQESEFNPRAYSRAGARGVMQLLPSTAKLTARKENLRYSRDALLADPEYNMTIGSAHLSHLLDRFDGSYIMTFVGYNAGPVRADRWVQDYGDPRSGTVDPIDWVELIPFSETRNYVQRVLENMQIYRARLNKAPIAGRLSADLERGGATTVAGKLARPSDRLDSLRPPDDARDLPPVSRLSLARAEEAQQNQPVARTRPSHLKARPVSAPDGPRRRSDPGPVRPSGVSAAIRPAPEKQTPAKMAVPSSPEENADTRQILAPVVPDLAPTILAPTSRSRENPTGSDPSPSAQGQHPQNDIDSDDQAEGSQIDLHPSVASPAETGIVERASCEDYRAYIARNFATEDGGADDLNSAMLAELLGKAGCTP